MRYLVDLETKEHVKYGSVPPAFNINGWDVVEADAEGWIKWNGGECPLPDNAPLEYIMRDDGQDDAPSADTRADNLRWEYGDGFPDADIIAYRPILDKSEVETMLEQPECTWPECSCEKADCIRPPEPTVKESLTVDDLLNRLDAAHEAAAQIPDILAELRERVGKHGYDIVARSPFVERTDYESEVVESVPASETTKEDMTDWRNWREGDYITIETEPKYDWWTLFKPYEIKLDGYGDLVVVADDGDEYSIVGDHRVGRFRFHSRPEQSK